MGPGVRAIIPTLSPSRETSPKAPSSRWKAKATSQAPSVGEDVNGAEVEKIQGQATVQLQFSKYSPRSDHAGTAVSAIRGSFQMTIDPCDGSGEDPKRISRHIAVKTRGRGWHPSAQ